MFSWFALTTGSVGFRDMNAPIHGFHWKKTHPCPCASDAACPCWSACPPITPLQAFRLDGDDADVCHQLGLMLWQTETTLKTYEARFQEARPMCSMFMHVSFFRKCIAAVGFFGILQDGSSFSLVKSLSYNEQTLWLLSAGWLKSHFR